MVVALLPHVSTYDGTRLLLKRGFLLALALLLAAAGNVLPLANVSVEAGSVHACTLGKNPVPSAAVP